MAGAYFILYLAICFVLAVPVAAKITGKSIFQFIAEDYIDE